MARNAKNVATTPTPQAYTLIDTRNPSSPRKGTDTYRKTQQFQSECLRATLTKLAGFQLMGFATTVDVEGYSLENPEDCEVTFTFSVVTRPGSKKLIGEVDPAGGILYPEQAPDAVESARVSEQLA
jgi:hypothetical protein